MIEVLRIVNFSVLMVLDLRCEFEDKASSMGLQWLVSVGDETCD